MVTQEEEFADIRRDVEENGLDHAKERIVEYQKRLYALDLEGEVNFYAQDRHGIPVARASTVVGDETFYSTMLVRNDIDRLAWKDVKRPKNWNWSAWPPIRPNDLVGCRSVDERCAECEGLIKYDGTRGDDDYMSWVLRKLTFWHENINIRLHERTGFGLTARHHIPKGTYLGEYTGMIVPWYGNADDSEADYLMKMECGSILPGANRLQYTCRIDNTRKGSIFRFLNHSCEPNATLQQMRCGLHNRINVVVTSRAIEPEEQITILCSENWFNDDNPCHCRAKNCRSKRKKQKESASAKTTAQSSATKPRHRDTKDRRPQGQLSRD